MGLALGAVACARRHWWGLAGILLALAFLSQQFALLVAVPLFVVAPKGVRLRFSIVAATTLAIVALPLLAVTSGTPNRVLRAIALGSGDSGGSGGTLVRELHLQGWLLTGVSRVVPIALAALLAWWLACRLGAAVLSPLPLTALLALSLSLRLGFEENLHHTYSFMALAVALVLLDVVRGHIRGAVLAWVALVTLAYDTGAFIMSTPLIRGLVFREHLPEVLVALGLLVIIIDMGRGRIRHLALRERAVGDAPSDLVLAACSRVDRYRAGRGTPPLVPAPSVPEWKPAGPGESDASHSGGVTGVETQHDARGIGAHRHDGRS